MPESFPPSQETAPSTEGWKTLVTGESGLFFGVIALIVLLHAMNALLMSTVLPSAVADIGGVAYMGWATSIFMIASVTAAAGAGRLKLDIGGRNALLVGALIFLIGCLLCAFAPSMWVLILGRFFQGFGGGLMAALSYALIGNLFPETLWPRIFATLSGVWGVAALAGPFIGGMTTALGSWRLAFFIISFMASLMLIAIYWRFPSLKADEKKTDTSATHAYPLLRLCLIALSILLVSIASTQDQPFSIALFGLSGIAAFIIMKIIDARAPNPLLPTNAFTTNSVVGLGLWVALLLSMANDPFALFGPLFLQTIHGLTPLQAGYMVAIEAMSWTLVAVLVASLPDRYQPGLIIAGALVMTVGLLGASRFLPDGPLFMIVPVAILLGGGIGGCWAFLIQRVMSFAKPGEEDIAASAVATTQMIGIAFGAVIAGLGANMAGLAQGITLEASRNAAFWVPVIFVPATLGAGVAAYRLTQRERVETALISKASHSSNISHSTNIEV